MVVCVRGEVEWSDMSGRGVAETANLITHEVAPCLLKCFDPEPLVSLAASKLGSHFGCLGPSKSPVDLWGTRLLGHRFFGGRKQRRFAVTGALERISRPKPTLRRRPFANLAYKYRPARPDEIMNGESCALAQARHS